MEIILEIIFELLFELFIQVVAEIGIGFGIEIFKERRGTTSKGESSVFVISGLLLYGAILGGISTWIIPYRLFNLNIVNGLSIFISPLVTGLIMKVWGGWRESNGKYISHISTFWGGAIFAFGTALTRWLLLRSF